MNAKGIFYAVVATVVFVTVLTLLRLFFRKLVTRVEAAWADSDWDLKLQQLDCERQKTKI